MNIHEPKHYKNVYTKFMAGTRFMVDMLFTDEKKYQYKTTFRFQNQTNGINCLNFLPEKNCKNRGVFI